MGSMCLRVAEELDETDLTPQELYVTRCIPPELKSSNGAVLREGSKTMPLRSNSKGSQDSEVSTADTSSPDLAVREARELQVSPFTRRSPPKVPKRKWDPATAVPVELHVYDIGTSGRGSCFNRLLRPFGTGAFHCGVEVYSSEWSFSDTTSRMESTGVFKSSPRQCPGHTYCESVLMGRTSCSEAEVLSILATLKQDWQVGDYDLLRRNCCHFADELCWRLGVGAIPAWVTNLAAGVASVEEGAERFGQRAEEVCSCALCCTTAELEERVSSSNIPDISIEHVKGLQSGLPMRSMANWT